jgi:hypothetical protein
LYVAPNVDSLSDARQAFRQPFHQTLLGTSTRLENYKQARLLLSTGAALVTVEPMGASLTAGRTISRTPSVPLDPTEQARRRAKEDADVS